ncbi:collagen binding domain-containing protein [Anaerococcus sp.]|uniref:MSCRAMM family protein n=1 Tax=Anaerococcus sp. TaxID=1872515 RepID=UPI0027B9C9E9|nr:SpaA isopeptide-forming pilin-related protein [Anaerococcus sp.]
MKTERKFKLLVLILPVLMLIQAFVLTPTGFAQGGTKENLSIEYDISAWSANKSIEENDDDKFFKNFDFKSSQRQVRYWKLDEDSLKDKDLLKLRDDYNKKSEKDLMADENLGEGQLSELAKIKYNGKFYDEIDFSSEEFKDFTKDDLSKLNTERILIKDLEPGYYLIKETDDSKERVAAMDKEYGQKSGDLVTAIIKIPDDIKEKAEDGSLIYHMKEKVDIPVTDLRIIKVDKKNHNKKLDKVEFKLYVRDKGSKEEGALVNFTGDYGKYVYSSKEVTADQIPNMKTNTYGKIVVSDLPVLPDGKEYYFKEVGPVGEYKNIKNINHEVTGLNSKDERTVENERIPFLHKTDDKGKNLENAEFKVYDKDGKALTFKKDDGSLPEGYGYGYMYDPEDKGKEEILTDGTGDIFLGGIPKGENYSIKETKAPTGFKLNEEAIKFDVDENGVILFERNGKKEQATIPFVNIPVGGKTIEKNPKGGRKFVKVAYDDETEKLKGAKFRVVKIVDGNKEDVFKDKKYYVTSDENGNFEVNDLPYEKDGTTYYLEETDAPNGYMANTKPIPFKISATSYSETHQTITNEKEPPKEETPPPPETPSTPTKTLTSRSRGPLVKTGDIRIWIYFAIGLLMIVAGSVIIKNQDKKQELA